IRFRPMKPDPKEGATDATAQAGMFHQVDQGAPRGAQRADSRAWKAFGQCRANAKLPHPALPCMPGRECGKRSTSIERLRAHGSPAKVSHWSMLPLPKPVLNHFTRCAEVPWVNVSGRTRPCACCCKVSSPIWLAAFRA